jgi:hypothetical protein
MRTRLGGLITGAVITTVGLTKMEWINPHARTVAQAAVERSGPEGPYPHERPETTNFLGAKTG